MDFAPVVAYTTHRLLELDRPDDVRRAIVMGVSDILRARASAVALWEGAEPDRRCTEEGVARGASPDRELERELLRRLHPDGPARSTLDEFGEPALDAWCRAHTREGRHCQVRPLLVRGGCPAAVAFHLEGDVRLDRGQINALRRYCGSAGLALEGAHARQSLRQMAYTDSLTGIANRRALAEVMERLGERGERLAILFVDFDGLKAVNEELSYDDGDAVIEAVGGLLGAVSDDRHIPGRLGGDEFVVVLAGADEASAARDARALSDALAQLELSERIRPLFRGASVGWALAHDGEGHEALVRRASAEMRAVKARRKGLAERR